MDKANSIVLEGYLNTVRLFANVIPDQYVNGRQCYMAQHLLLPGCMSHGGTPEEAIENLKDACNVYLQGLIENKLPVPDLSLSISQGTLSSSTIWESITSGEIPLPDPSQVIAPTAKFA